MGLPLRNFPPSLSSGPTAPGGPSGTPDSDPDPDLDSDPLCHRNRQRHTKNPHRACRGTRCLLGLEAQCNRARRPHARARQSHHHQAYALPVAAETHRLKPRNQWAADADEGYALAQSAIQLPGEHYPSQGDEQVEGRARQTGRSRSRGTSVSSSSSSSSRPPSLERQDAFRDEKTVKRRRGRDRPRRMPSVPTWAEDEQHSPVRTQPGDLDAAQVSELYRMGLLYDDEHERGAGFSLDAIVRDPEEPVYSLRVRPTRRGRRDDGDRDDRDGTSLSVDLAFSVFGEDEALAGWLLSGSSQGQALEEPRPWIEAGHDTHNPRLTVIYELADDAVSAVSGDDFLDSVSVSEVSYCGEDDDRVWALSDGCNAAPGTAASVVEVEGDVGPWVVLGPDGS